MSVSEEDSLFLDVLLVEDSPGDVRLTREVLLASNKDIRLHVVPDGVEAMDFLNRKGPYADAPRPDLILLDLNLPRMDGREVLARIKQDAILKSITTMILSTSNAEEDITQCYSLQANCFLTKPAQLEDFERLIRSISDFWLTRVMFPQRVQSA
jgi:two-component system, chemotaxis family, response regulator Rcp1